jgi:rubrerythrin
VTGAVATRSAPDAERDRLFAADAVEPRRRTLEDAVVAALAERRLRGAAPCLVCGAPTDGDGPCPSCGAELS